MDSLTQIVLGAAVGEAALGKKVGNRAMIWGAIAGTIPDLDVFANYFLTPIDALAFHRGISHGLFTNFVLALILGFSVYKLYQQTWHRWVGIGSWCLLGIAIMGYLSFSNGITGLKFLLFLALSSGWTFIIYLRYFRKGYATPEASLGGWTWLFILGLITHPILDCFTNYGTQIFQPFSNYRVAFNNISVVDPLYTLPFLVCLLSAAAFDRIHPSRRFWNNAGLILSSLYMIFTIVNKTRVNTIFENSLAMDEIKYERFMTTPTILNNALWYGLAESEDAYYVGLYSFLDKEKKFTLNTIPKSYLHLGDTLSSDYTLRTLSWFSDGYFNIKKIGDYSYEYTDLRFGGLPLGDGEEEQPVFKFNLRQDQYGVFEMLEDSQKPENMDIKMVFQSLWNRILGRTHEE